MAIQAETGINQEALPQSILLARQARREWETTGKTTVICPKCGKSPKITTISNGERIIIRCECAYIKGMEISF